MKSTSSLDYVRWARRQAPDRGLTRGQSQMLQQLASHANERGECLASVATLAGEMVVSERHAGRLLRELATLGLASTTRRGRGRSARRRLCLDAPIPAPACPRGTQPMFDACFAPTATVAAPVVAAADDRTSETSDLPSDGRQKEPLEGAPGVLEERLDDVVQILDAAPGLFVEAMAVNSALAAHPERSGYDHLQAAHTVASFAFEGGLHVTSANRLLLAELRKQTRGAQSANRQGAPHGGRRRAAPPVTDTVAAGDELLRQAWERERQRRREAADVV